jgi:hypothetical protein
MIRHHHHRRPHKVVQESLIVAPHDFLHCHQIQDLYMVSTKELLVVELPLPGFQEFHQNYLVVLEHLVLDNYP